MNYLSWLALYKWYDDENNTKSFHGHKALWMEDFLINFTRVFFLYSTASTNTLDLEAELWYVILYLKMRRTILHQWTWTDLKSVFEVLEINKDECFSLRPDVITDHRYEDNVDRCHQHWWYLNKVGCLIRCRGLRMMKECGNQVCACEAAFDPSIQEGVESQVTGHTAATEPRRTDVICKIKAE